MDFKVEYKRWLERVTDKKLHRELEAMDEAEAEDAFTEIWLLEPGDFVA